MKPIETANKDMFTVKINMFLINLANKYAFTSVTIVVISVLLSL